MTDQNGKTLSLKRNRKRFIKRDDLSATKLAKTKAPPKPAPKKKPKASAPKRPELAPSAIRLDNLNASLNAFDVWRNFQPLALGIEKAVFQHIAKHSLSASKRVVQNLLHRHTHDRRYLQAIQSGACRFNLDGSEATAIAQAERDHAARVLVKQ